MNSPHPLKPWAKDPDAASFLRRLIDGYLSLQKVANIVMVLEAYHTNHQGWLDFLREMRAMLRTGGRESPDSVENQCMTGTSTR